MGPEAQVKRTAAALCGRSPRGGERKNTRKKKKSPAPDGVLKTAGRLRAQFFFRERFQIDRP